MAEIDIQRYLDNIEAQHRSAPKFMATLTALLEKVDDATRAVRDMPRSFSLDEAAGAQLDVLGVLAGIDRRHGYEAGSGTPALLGDEAYRTAIRTKVVSNQWDGTVESFRRIWRGAVPDNLISTLVDNQDMTVDMNLIGEVDYSLIQLILSGEYLPKPAGVTMNVSITERSAHGEAVAWPVTAVSGMGSRAGAMAGMNRTGARAINASSVTIAGALAVPAASLSGLFYPAQTYSHNPSLTNPNPLTGQAALSGSTGAGAYSRSLPETIYYATADVVTGRVVIMGELVTFDVAGDGCVTSTDGSIVIQGGTVELPLKYAVDNDFNYHYQRSSVGISPCSHFRYFSGESTSDHAWIDQSSRFPGCPCLYLYTYDNLITRLKQQIDNGTPMQIVLPLREKRTLSIGPGRVMMASGRQTVSLTGSYEVRIEYYSA